MKIELHEITVRELVEGYVDSGVDGVVAYGGRLDVRPAYQREFVYRDRQRNAVIDTVMKGYPLNVMYWVEREDGGYEVMDGQQRTISICQFCNNDFSYGMRYFHNLEPEVQKRFLDYRLLVYFCSGENEEKIAWFQTINIAGEELTPQELRNAIYRGPWVANAKTWFSKPGCPAAKIGGDNLSGSRERQEYLETAIEWISGTKGEGVCQYMALHQHDPDASELWTFFQQVITWLEAKFRHTSDRKKILKGVDWGALYRAYGKTVLDPERIEKDVRRLLMDDDVTNKRGIAPYVLSGDERHLSIRAFTDAQKLAAFTRQKGVCPLCGKTFVLEEMHADHIRPWSKGGTTTADNCQMLCHACNFGKGGK